ncbi:cytochrome c biogenesis CcdA family protein [Ornithinimicrobium kibberense]|uniref:Cytochrome c biogenesis CcdA family protein n=1 Tax=Ornithinimicrobium kibberense TaxID=282060 RepID=A0ABV5V3U0_9MICO|nr:cytochrome c biogenesis CcdA family protein [Ornithinimicrobium kibberense]
MGELLTTGSVLAAFLAGGVALFAPCCIVFLAPSYLAAAVKNRRWRLLPLTFLFAAGLGLVMVPITLGIGLVASAVANYHTPLYYAGGALMLALAAVSLSGRMLTLPASLRAPDTRGGDGLSFFSLGVFSGIASSCCAPVLAGVMTLSALSGSAVGGFALGLAYTFGMVFPLFVMALFWDRFRLGERRFLQARPVRLQLGGRVLATNSINIVVAAAFTAMGIFVIYLAGTGTMTNGPESQVEIGQGLAGLFDRFEQWVSPLPEPLLGLGVMALAAVFVVATLRDRRRPQGEPRQKEGVSEADAPADTCHHAPALHTGAVPDDAEHR